jgi:hypothetical protein
MLPSIGNKQQGSERMALARYRGNQKTTHLEEEHLNGEEIDLSLFF